MPLVTHRKNIVYPGKERHVNYNLTYTKDDIDNVISAGRFGLWGWDEDEDKKVETSSPPAPSCNHEWVNISLNHVKLACKHCGIDKLSKD